ncbi:MAG: ABC transporter ATP-binding protein [Alphaproteobacteria bacterium]|nr:ABC transporter ATP-binding protein [Alphaproteobacteria bacterium]
MLQADAAAARTSVDLRLEEVSKNFGSVAALRPSSLAVEAGLLVSLLGPSGCGKTTTLRLIAGFEAPDTGRVVIGGQDVGDLPPNRRRLGMVFQNYSLFPHMTVGENVAFGLKIAGTGRDEAHRRVRSILELVRLPGFEDRFAHQLSGGQQQRVALARSLVTNPSVLLLDEPLGALDKNLRESMQFELRRIQQSLGITTILVTHDQEEALTMSDRVAVMNHGSILQYGTPTEVYDHPRTRFVSEFLGTSNLFRGRAARGPDGAGIRVEVPRDGAPPVVLRVARNGAAPKPGEPALVAIRPEKMRLTRTAPPALGRELDGLTAKVIDSVFRGTYHAYQLALPGRGDPLFVYQQTIDADGQGVFPTGSDVHVTWSPDNVVALADDGDAA